PPHSSYSPRARADLVAELDHAGVVGPGLDEVEGDVGAELLEERDAVADEDRQDRVAQLVGEAEAQACGGGGAAADEPDVAEARAQALVHERREVAGEQLDRVAVARQVA